MTAEDFIRAELAAGRLTLSHVAELTRSFQRDSGLDPVDGMPGPATRAALANLLAATLQSPAPVDRLGAAGERAVAAAHRLWLLDIIDPKPNDRTAPGLFSNKAISALISDCGWTWEVPYRGDPLFQWCGIFAGACWKDAGLDPKWLRDYFASTIRLSAWAHYKNFGNGPANPVQTPGRLIAVFDAHSTSVPFAPRAGDILTIGDGVPAEGDHICVVESFDAATGTFLTYEGNGNGIGPKGNDRQGIVRGQRKLGGSGYCVRMLIRPSEGDLL